MVFLVTTLIEKQMIHLIDVVKYMIKSYFTANVTNQKVQFMGK